MGKKQQPEDNKKSVSVVRDESDKKLNTNTLTQTQLLSNVVLSLALNAYEAFWLG